MGTAQLHLDFLADIPSFSFPVRLLLTPFRQHVGSQRLENAKQQCARAAQETYDRDLRAVIRHDFIFRKEDVEVFLWPQSTKNTLARLLPTNGDECYHPIPGRSIDHLPQVNTGQGVSYTQQQDDYGTLKASYVNAQLAKNLASEQIPREVSVNTLGVDRWDPFKLQRHHLKKAILSSDKLHNIQKLISMFILKLPTAVEWEKFAYANELMSENIRELLLEALCSDVATVPSPVESTLAEFGRAAVLGVRLTVSPLKVVIVAYRTRDKVKQDGA